METSLMRQLIRRYWPLLGLVLVALLVGFHFVEKGLLVFKELPFEQADTGEGLRLRDVHYTQDDPAQELKWTLDAEEVRFSQDRETIYFTEFSLEVRSESRPPFHLKGKQGKYSKDSGSINLWGDLEGVSENGFRVVTQQISIDEKTACLKTNKPVQIWGPSFSVEGQGLFADLKKKRFRILSNVTTTIEKEAVI